MVMKVLTTFEYKYERKEEREPQGFLGRTCQVV